MNEIGIPYKEVKHAYHLDTEPTDILVFSGPQGSWSVHVCCLLLKMEFRSCARGRQWCGIIHYY